MEAASVTSFLLSCMGSRVGSDLHLPLIPPMRRATGGLKDPGKRSSHSSSGSQLQRLSQNATATQEWTDMTLPVESSPIVDILLLIKFTPCGFQYPFY